VQIKKRYTVKSKGFGFILLIISLWSGVNAQNLPGGLPVQFPKGALSTGLPVLTDKPEIPYLEELRQIQSLKESYDSLRSELGDLREMAGDSTRRDSVLNIAKARSREVLEREGTVLGSLIESGNIPGKEIKNAAKNTLDRVNDSNARLKEINGISGLESLMDQNGENLKALTNEWIMPKVEELRN